MSEFFDFAQTNGFALVRLDRHKKFSTAQGWQADFSRDRADWEKWVAEGFNVGVHAGASRLITFDLDSKHGGIEAVRQRFDEWCASNAWLRCRIMWRRQAAGITSLCKFRTA
jgi:hypothetical protein